MNRFHKDCILSEKTMNTSTSNTSHKRHPLTKAYSCSDASSSNNLNGNCAFITPSEFVELISKKSDAHDLPIFDCRSQIDFGCERIRSSHNINCRTKIMARKLASKCLEDVEPNLSSTLDKHDTVILYDQSTDLRGEEKISSLPISLVVQAAQKSNKRVQIIQGGLDAVKTEYPEFIECPTNSIRNKNDDDEPPPSTPEAIDKENVSMTEILPHIFVGNTSDAQNLERLAENHITHIINCTPDLPFFWENKHQYLRINVLDLPSQNIRQHFDQAIEFIDKALCSKDNNVLVHCSAGISRSPTLVLAYMIYKHHLTLDEAFEKMRQLRQIVDPNISFILQLREWEKTLRSSTSSTNDTTIHEDNSGTNTTPRSASTYCGSTSKSKTDNKKSLADSSDRKSVV